ncbi:MAG: universal stress protein [Gemmatimonadaceae bacterium]|nr:universal stress protein [Gemmatimonadaceae bacterium]
MSANSPDPAHHDPVRRSGTDAPVVVACDGAPASQESLFHAARLAGDAFGGLIQILGVVEPTPAVAAGMDIIPAPIELDELRKASMLEDIRRTLSVSADGDPAWPSEVKVGSPPRVLADEAKRRGASMLVMGIGRHNPLDRLFGTETTLSTLRESTVPVLAVGMNFPSAPKHAVVGMDFSAASIHAARLALRMLGSDAHLTLVHVRPRFEHPSADWQAWDADYGKTLPPLFEQIRHQLDAPPSVVIDTVTVRGDPAPALLAFAQQSNAELIALGTQRHGLIERLIVGSVATRVLRTSRCAVLAVPAGAVPAAAIDQTQRPVDTGKAA